MEPLVVGRYALFDELAAGGMATVHLGRLLGSEGFGRTVAVKRMHANLRNDPDFGAMFMDEARIVARIRHPNVVQTVDVVQWDDVLYLVMDYVHGESLSWLLRRSREAGVLPEPKVVATILHDALLGLHAAHETTAPTGEALGVVHRDVSPQNIIVGLDGVARVLDFGIAKAAGRAQVTRNGELKGKLSYMAPEQIRGNSDRRADVFATAVCLWEALAGKRLHEGLSEVDIVQRVVMDALPPPSSVNPALPSVVDEITRKGLAADPDERYPTAKAMALDLEKRIGLVTAMEVGAWVEALAGAALGVRSERIAAMERASLDLEPKEVPSLRPTADSDEPTRLEEGGSNATPAGIANTSPRPRGSRILAIVVFVVAGGIGAALFDAGRRPPERRVVARTAEITPADPIPKPTTAPVVSVSPAVDPTPTAAPAHKPVGVPVRPAKTAPRPPKEAEPKAAAPVATPAAAPAAAPICDPPYTIDEAGHRHYKLECLAKE